MQKPFISVLAAIAICAGAVAADKWDHVNVQTQPELAGNEIQFIETMPGEVWIGTLSGLTRLRDGKYTAIKQVRIKKKRKWVKQGGKRKRVVEEVKEVKKAKLQAWDILKLGRDEYLVGTDRGIYRLQGDLMDNPAIQGYTVSPIVRYDDKTIWALGKNKGNEQNHVFTNAGGEWKRVEAFKDKRVDDMYQTADGHIWVGIDGDGVIEVDPQKGVDKAVHHLRGMKVTSVFRDSKGNVWVGSWGGGIAKRSDGKWTGSMERQKKAAILRFAEDKSGTVWAATTSSGVWMSTGEKWTMDLKDEGLINLLVATSDGRVYVSSQRGGGLRYWNGKTWEVSLDSPLPMRCLVEQKDGTLYAGGVLDGIHIKKK